MKIKKMDTFKVLKALKNKAEADEKEKTTDKVDLSVYAKQLAERRVEVLKEGS